MRYLPPLNALRAFEAAARHLSFKAAAEELHVTPTAISHQIRLLEDICGCELFRRQPRPISLTAEGQILLPVLKDGFDNFAAAIERLKNTADRPLVISVTTAYAAYWLMPRLRRWREISDIELEVRASETPVDLHAGEVDIAVRYAKSPPTGVKVVKIADDVFTPMGRPDVIGDRLNNPEDIVNFTLTDFRSKMPGHFGYVTWEKWLGEAIGDPQKAEALLSKAKFLKFSEASHAMDAALAGEGLALASNLLVGHLLDNGTLIAPFDITLPGMNDYALYLASNPRPELIEQFVGWLQREHEADTT
ncbi:LysR family transcriptional regulator [Aestuariispira ectoiniformans]|uniref:LysR family transcriptional regulator n=1 Tax=Aestuariispira ectoiniformans TaxID=2775080 RepID=UPI00223AAB66|nr:LysR family transcriptional regulator [Aestuariispira ectoiniformans]